MKESQKGFLYLILFSVFVGSVGVIVKIIKNMDIFAIIFFRAFIGLLLISSILLLRKKTNELAPKESLLTPLVGIFQAICIYMYFTALLTTTIATAALLLYTAPIFTLLLAPFVLKEKIQKETIGTIGITLIGVILILDPANFSFQHTLGLFAGLCAGFFYACTTIATKSLSKKASSEYIVFWQGLIVSALFSFSLLTLPLSTIFENILPLFALGIITYAIPFLLFVEGVKRVLAQRITLITTLEPVVAMISACAVLGEFPSLLTLIGGVFILTGVLIASGLKPSLQVHLPHR